MTQSPSVVPSTHSSHIHPINPALEAALGSLDVQLDEELTRYRRQRSGRPVMSSRGLGRAQSRKSIDLIALDAGGNRSQSPVSAIALGTPMTPSLLASTLTSANQAAAAKPSETILPPQINRQAVPSSASTPLSYSLTDEFTSPPPQALETANLAGDSGGTAPHLQITPGGELVYPAGMQTEPEDYLASSEQLLRSLAEEEAPPRKERRFTDNLLTPLGVGSILLLLLSSAIVGYILVNPSSISHLGLNKLWKSQNPTVAKNPSQIPVGMSNAPVEPPIPNAPNLATDEFVDLNLNNLSTLKTSPKVSVVQRQPDLSRQVTTPAMQNPLPSSANSGGPQNLAAALLPPAQQPVTLSPLQQPPTASAPTRTLAPSQEAAPSQASANSKSVTASNEALRKDLYYVVTNYDSDRSLEEARKVVKDAYVHKFPEGDAIQMGAYPRESQAKAFVEQLEKQGISASIYHP